MLADVRLLRHDGRRISRERIAAAVPVRGILAVVKPRGVRPIASLLDDRLEPLLPPLDDVSLTRWRGADVVLVGFERIGRLRDTRTQLQAWWCRLLGHEDG